MLWPLFVSAVCSSESLPDSRMDFPLLFDPIRYLRIPRFAYILALRSDVKPILEVIRILHRRLVGLLPKYYSTRVKRKSYQCSGYALLVCIRRRKLTAAG